MTTEIGLYKVSLASLKDDRKNSKMELVKRRLTTIKEERS
jgi:hypothetical protein